MAYIVPVQVSFASAPSVTDDASKGFGVGSIWVDTSPATPVPYACLDASVGTAVWRRVGGVTTHTGLSNLSWALSGHGGTQNGVAAFNGSNVATLYTPVTDGSVLAFSGGVLQWTSPPQPSVAIGERTYDVQFQTSAPDIGVDSFTTTSTYSFITLVAPGSVTGLDTTSATGTVV